MIRLIAGLALALCTTAPSYATTCDLTFTVEVTQGVGFIRPGTQLPGRAVYTTDGRSFRQEGGSTGHLAQGAMTLGDDIEGRIWTLITTSRGHAADLVGVYARDVEGFSFAGVDFEGPMALTLFGEPGTRADATVPTSQAEWDQMDVRRSFSLQAHGVDMLAGEVLDLAVQCS